MIICMYSKKSGESFEKAQEHIIPAFLGGKNLLPAEYVSKETNILFSRLEGLLAHQSGISYFRSLYGPGKRGRSVKNPFPLISYDHRNKGFLVKKVNEKIIALDQIEIIINKNGYSIYLYLQGQYKNKEEFSEAFSVYNDFVDKADNNSTIFMNDSLGKTDRYIISRYKNKWFILSKGNQTLNQIKNKVKSSKPNLRNNELAGKLSMSSLSLGKTCQESEETRRATAKIIFNVCAYFVGKEDILSSKYDNLRDYIYGKKDLEKNPEKFTGYIDFRSLSKDLVIKNKVHIILIFDYAGNRYGFASFYGGAITHLIKICDTNEDNEKISIYICDWESKREFTKVNLEVKKYIIDQKAVNRTEGLYPETVLDRKINKKVSQAIKELRNDYPEYRFVVTFNTSLNIGFSSIEYSGKYKAGHLIVNWSLSDELYDLVLFQGVVTLKLYIDKVLNVTKPRDLNNINSGLIAAAINFLLIQCAQDINSSLFGYNPEILYRRRFMNVVTKIINTNETILKNEFVINTLTLEVAALFSIDNKYYDELKNLIGEMNIKVLNDAQYIASLIKSLGINKNDERFAVAEKILIRLKLKKDIIINPQKTIKERIEL